MKPQGGKKVRVDDAGCLTGLKQLLMLPAQSVAPAQHAIRADENSRVDHAEVVRQAKNLRPQLHEAAKRNERIEGELEDGEPAVQWPIEQSDVRARRGDERNRNDESCGFVRQEKEEHQRAWRPEERADLPQLFDVARHDTNAAAEAAHLV